MKMKQHSQPLEAAVDASSESGINATNRVDGKMLSAAEAEIERWDAQLGEALQLTFPASDPIAVFVPERSPEARQSDNPSSQEVDQE